VQKIRGCLFADNVLYDTEKDVWVRPEGDLAVIGVDTARAWLSGVYTSVSFKEPGVTVERGKTLGATEGPRHFDVVRSPLTGVVVEVNSALKTTPKLLNSDPYGKGWFIKIRPSRFDEEKKALKGVGAATAALEQRILTMNVRCFDAFPDYEMYEIGSECAGVLVKLDDLITRSPPGTVVHLVSDDVTSEIELIAWSDRTHQEIVETRREGNLFHFIVRKTH
jgi:glycine cleavage system H protein